MQNTLVRDFICPSVVVPKFDDASSCIIQIFNVFLIYCSVQTERRGFVSVGRQSQTGLLRVGTRLSSQRAPIHLPPPRVALCVSFLCHELSVCCGGVGYILYLGSPPSLRVNTGHFNAGPYPRSPAVTQHSPLLYALQARQWD